MKLPRPFDRDRSLRLDALIIALENNPSALRRIWLCLCKRRIERQIPRFVTVAPVAPQLETAV